MRIADRLAAVLLLVAAAACGPAGPPPVETTTPVPVPGGELVVGSVSLQAGREHGVFEPFVSYLADHLHDVGIGRGRVVVEGSLLAMAEHLADGTVDLYIDSPFPVAFAARQTGAVPFLRRWKNGIASYDSVVFSRRAAGIETVNDLRGRVIAFGEPFSTSSYLMPKAALSAAGLELARYEDPGADVPPDRVGYVFSGDSENTLFWVLKGRIAAGAVNRDYFEEMAGTRRGELTVLLQTPEVPRNIVCHRAGLDPAVVAAVTRILIGMVDDEEGRKVLAGFEGTLRFDRFAEGPSAALAPIYNLLQYVEEDLGESGAAD